MTDNRRWYDKDPSLKEALELLSLSSKDEKDQAAEFIQKLQDQVAADVIESVYETMNKYCEKGSRWYDQDPFIMKAIELLRVAPPHVQRAAAKKLIKALSKDDIESLNLEALNIEEE